MRTTVISIIAACLTAGCVPKGQHELVEVQLDATRTALSARQAQCMLDLRGREDRIGDLEREVAERGLQLEAIDDYAHHLEGELEQLREDKVTWLASLPAPAPDPDPDEEPEEPTDEQKWIEAEVEAMRLALAAAAQHRVRTEHRVDRQRAVEARFAQLVDDGWVSVRSTTTGSVVTIPGSKLFTEGRVSLSPRGERILEDSAKALRELGDHHLQIRGHTDDRPLHTATHASNWELGFDQAITVLRGLEGYEIGMEATAASFAATEPIADNTTPEGQKTNRRIELWLTPDPDVRRRFPVKERDQDRVQPEPEPEPEPAPAPEDEDAEPSQKG